ncbi:MAG: prolyl oligopeptidase family serine peptidase [Elusimicrobia bacterium]|nr:prolyl oligopeptidase family serine peptidase [Elusimicrobiota bacterium]
MDGRLDALAAREGFLVVYPDGLGKHWNDGRDGNDADPEADDAGFLAALADKLVKDGKADPKRLYAVGISNGGFMAHALACADAGRWAAIGAVAASLGQKAAASCKPSRPVPVLMVNGTEDRLVPWDGREVRFLGRVRGKKLTVPETDEKWAALDGCTGEPERSELPDAEDDGTRWSLSARRRCQGGSEVLLYKVDGGGHTWPRGKPYLKRLVGRTSRDVDFESLVWTFFKAHPLPRYDEIR